MTDDPESLSNRLHDFDEDHWNESHCLLLIHLWLPNRCQDLYKMLKTTQFTLSNGAGLLTRALAYQVCVIIYFPLISLLLFIVFFSIEKKNIVTSTTLSL